MKYIYIILLLILPTLAFKNNIHNNNPYCSYRNLNSNIAKQNTLYRRLILCSVQHKNFNLEPLKAEPETIAKALVAVGAGTFVLYSLISNYRQRKVERDRIEKELRHLEQMKNEYIRTGIDPDVKKLR